jgi:hypothetical protein
MFSPDRRTAIVGVILGLVGGALVSLSVVMGVIIILIGTALLIWVGADWIRYYHQEPHPFVRAIVQRMRYLLDRIDADYPELVEIRNEKKSNAEGDRRGRARKAGSFHYRFS